MPTPARCLLALTAATLAVWIPADLAAGQQSPQVTSLLTAARQALGGDTGTAGIQSFRISGRIKSANRLESGSFDILCVLPDRFVQIEDRAIISPGQLVAEPVHGPAVEHRTTTLGFNGGALVFQPHVNARLSRYTTFPPTRAQLDQAFQLARTGFANLTLGLFAESFAGVPLTFSEATGTDADISVRVSGQDVSGTLTFNRQTRLPDRFGRMRYDDYREVHGRQVPFRITDGRDEWLVRTFATNVAIDAKVFRPTFK